MKHVLTGLLRAKVYNHAVWSRSYSKLYLNNLVTQLLVAHFAD